MSSVMTNAGPRPPCSWCVQGGDNATRDLGYSPWWLWPSCSRDVQAEWARLMCLCVCVCVRACGEDTASSQSGKLIFASCGTARVLPLSVPSPYVLQSGTLNAPHLPSPIFGTGSAVCCAASGMWYIGRRESVATGTRTLTVQLLTAKCVTFRKVHVHTLAGWQHFFPY